MQFVDRTDPRETYRRIPKGEFSQEYFPKTFADTTPRKLLNEYRKHLDHAHIWTEGREIRYHLGEKKNWFTEARDWVQEWIDPAP